MERAARARLLDEFKTWAESYIGGVTPEEQGAELARRRREALRDMIRDDPAAAIRSALTPEVRRRLPPRVASSLEEEVSGFGDLWVAVSDEADPLTGRLSKGRLSRTVVVGGRTYTAFVYGRREGMTSKRNIPLHGIAVDGMLALDESPVRLLQTDDTRARRHGVEGAPGNGLAVEVGGVVKRFESRAQLDTFVQELTRRETAFGPNAAVNGDASSTWTVGPKRVLYMRVDFPDAQGEPLTAAEARSVIDDSANSFFSDNSNGQTSLRADVTPLLRMPQPTTYYFVSESSPEYHARLQELLFDARTAARAGGQDPSLYDLDIVAFTRIPILSFAGLAHLGASGAWINGPFGADVTIHELGHNYGLNHASFWNTSDGTVTGTGVSEEYADPYDIMGGSSLRHHFNAWFKSLLGWLPEADVRTVTTGGVYRIQAIDSPSASGVRALRIPSAHRADYWVEYRGAAGGEYLPNGALIHWGYDAEYTEFRKSHLLDMTTATDTYPFDAPLPIGETFTDNLSGVSIIPLRKLGTTPETLEVEVRLTKSVISGRVRGIFNSPLGGVTINVGGTESAVTQTDEYGMFSVALAPGGNYTLTPSLDGYIFDPPSLNVNGLSGSQRLPNFKAFTEGIQIVQFEKAAYNVSEAPGAGGIGAEGEGFVTLNVLRTGTDLSTPLSVLYATVDVTADGRRDYTRTLGTLDFAAGETSKSITVFVTDDGAPEPPETFNVTLVNTAGSVLGTNATAAVTIVSDDAAPGRNPVDGASFNPAFFVRQHYIDFLGREPDAAGLAFWKDNFTQCGADPQCLELRRVNVSAAFFLSIEFQETGYLVYRTHRAAFGDAFSPGAPGPVPFIRLEEFLHDTRRIGRGLSVGLGDWQRQLEDNKNAFFIEFIQRPLFESTYPSWLTPTEFVDRLDIVAGGVLSGTERAQIIAQLSADNTPRGRAAVLRRVAEDENLRRKEFNRAFVLMQFFGYLRRDPDSAPDHDFAGYNFWLTKLNEFNGNYIQAEMVKAFLNSTEYQQRFGQ